MTKIRTYEAEFKGNTFEFKSLPYNENNLPNSGYGSVKGNYKPVRVESKSDQVLIYAPADLNEHEIKKLKDDWEVSDVNF